MISVLKNWRISKVSSGETSIYKIEQNRIKEMQTKEIGTSFRLKFTFLKNLSL